MLTLTRWTRRIAATSWEKEIPPQRLAWFFMVAWVMTRFVVLDHSLTSVGGHHYEQAVQVLLAAERLGYEPVLATHRHFNQRDLLPSHWRVLPVFPDVSSTSLRPYPLDTQGRMLKLDDSTVACLHQKETAFKFVSIFQRRSERARYRRRIERFSEAISRVDAETRFGASDQVLPADGKSF